MPSRFSDPSWWPTPPPEKATPVGKLMLGSIVSLLAIGGAVAAIVTLGHSGHRAAAAATTTVASRTQDPAARTDGREAFSQCLRSVGGGGGGSQLGGRLGGGSSKRLREAFAVCRSLLQRGGSLPIAPQPGTTTPAPVA
jgi:hypothetical protein